MKTKNFLPLLFAGAILSFGACGNSQKANESVEQIEAEDEAFAATQPLESGLYDASYFDISGGANPRKGHFDGRIYFALSPELTAIYVFENGNRTKIDYYLAMQKPFEKTDSGTYVTTTPQGEAVTLKPDTLYSLQFVKGGSNVDITFDPKPRHTGDYMQIMEKIQETREKNK